MWIFFKLDFMISNSATLVDYSNEYNSIWDYLRGDSPKANLPGLWFLKGSAPSPSHNPPCMLCGGLEKISRNELTPRCWNSRQYGNRGISPWMPHTERFFKSPTGDVPSIKHHLRLTLCQSAIQYDFSAAGKPECCSFI